MTESIKVNGGSFKLSAVLTYPTEAAFVNHYTKILAGWLTEEKRGIILKEAYRIARELKKQEEGEEEMKNQKVNA